MRAILAVACLAPVLLGCDQAPTRAPPQSHIPAGLRSAAYPPPGWTWSWLTVQGAPPLRYGVGVRPRAARGVILIAPGFAEPAEVWFETADNLMEAGYAVWIMDLAGQGGSGRWARPADKAHLTSMDVNVTAVRAMLTEVIRPANGTPVVVLGSDLGGQAALRAAAAGLPEAVGLILSSPRLASAPLAIPPILQSPIIAKAAHLVGLDRTYATGQGDWRAAASRTAPARSRAASAQAWMRANPELRTGGVTWGWIRAYAHSAAEARKPALARRLNLPVLVLANDSLSRQLCDRVTDCAFVGTNGGAGHLDEGALRDLWLSAVLAFCDGLSADYVVAAAPAPP